VTQRFVLLTLPLVALVVLLARPALDIQWKHQPSHFWLVLGVAAVNVALGALTGDAARRRGDARLVLVSLAFMASAGFLGLHALATPGVLRAEPNAGFTVATSVGLFLAAALCALSSLEPAGPTAARVVRHQRTLGLALAALLVAWAVASLAAVPPLDDPISAERSNGLLTPLAVGAVGLFGIAAWRYLRFFERRQAAILLSLVAAFVLLAQAAVATAVGRTWRLSWWEWHVLMAIAFGLIAWSARMEYRRHASAAGAFRGLYLERTVERIDRRSAALLELLVERLERGEPLEPALADLQRREGLTDEELQILERSAREIRSLDELFRPYLSPSLAAQLRRDPQLARLGGVEREVSVLFADLAGFTSYSEGRRPADVVSLLNELWAAAVPAVLGAGGTIERFAGDAIMVVFNLAGDQPDHASRAVRAALALIDATADTARRDVPRFRVGISTGPALVGNVGSHEQRSFTAIGDTTNTAARLQTLAEPGGVVLAESTRAALGDTVRTQPLGALEVKGKRRPVEAHVLVAATAAQLGSPGPASERGD
jgi:class 3 adenylate cyclase